MFAVVGPERVLVRCRARMIPSLTTFGRFSSTRFRASQKNEDHALQYFLDNSGFGIFKVVKDLGYFGWEPSGQYCYKTMDKVTTKEILAQLNVECEPDELSGIPMINRDLPKRFIYLPPRKNVNRYPHDTPLIAALHVVKERNVQLGNIRFYFGGSTLEMLANKTVKPGSEYLVTRVPNHPNIISVSMFREYNQDYSEFGFQFERFVTGKQFYDPQASMTLHLQILEVSDNPVLFVAEVDAQKDGHPVEVTASDPIWWGTRIMFQMISSGSTTLCVGTKHRRGSHGTSLTRVHMETLSEVMKAALATARLKNLERNIRQGMEALKREATTLQEGEVKAIMFAGPKRTLTLRPVRGINKVLFPSGSKVEELI